METLIELAIFIILFSLFLIVGIIYRNHPKRMLFSAIGLISTVAIGSFIQKDGIMSMITICLPVASVIFLVAGGILYHKSRIIAIIAGVLAIIEGIYEPAFLYFSVSLLIILAFVASILWIGALLFKKDAGWAKSVTVMGALCLLMVISNGFRPIPEAVSTTSSVVSEKLAYIESTDQFDRKNIWLMAGMILFKDESAGNERDEMRHKQVLEMLENGEVNTPQDKLHAAMSLHHSGDSVMNRKAYELAQAAFDAGLQDAEWLSHATYDRWQMAIGNEQKYGTQGTVSFNVRKKEKE